MRARRVLEPIMVRVYVENPSCAMAATVFLPDPEILGPRPICMFALPGGGYARGYFDLNFEDHDGYSQARHHVEKGLIFVAIDHLGVGESVVENLELLRIEDIARADDATVRAILGMLAEGILSPDFPKVTDPFKVGIGQSMGGGVTIIMQGRYRTYDAIGVLGYSAIHTVLPQRTEAAREKAMYASSLGIRRDQDPRNISVVTASAEIEDFLYPFHWEDVPEDILQADVGSGFPLRAVVPPWGSPTTPNCVVGMLAPGYVKEEAAAIDVPVMIGVGERDTAPDPWAEPSAFRSSGDVTLLVAPGMAHMHNFAGTRALLWERLVRWSRIQAEAPFVAA